MKDETEPGAADSACSKHPKQWDLDYSLEPYTGLTPEYMEMSKIPWAFLPLGVGSDKGSGRGLGKQLRQPLLLPGLRGDTVSPSVPRGS